MINKYPPQDLVARLDSTVLLYDNIPYYIKVDGGKLILKDLKNISRDEKIIDPWDEKLDISSIPLGYFNMSGNNYSAYFKRVPVRRYKQGVCATNVTAQYLTPTGFIGCDREYLYSAGVFDGMINKYPSLDSAVSMLEKDWYSVAISRFLGLTNTVGSSETIVRGPIKKVFFKNDLIGTFNYKENVLEVSPEYRFYPIDKQIMQYSWSIK